jgi:nitroreductase
MSKSILEVLKSRRSIRSYKPDQIKDQELDEILEAGTWAPTGMGCQGVKIVAVQKPEIVAKIQKLNADVLKNPSAVPFYNAPTVVNVFIDKTKATPVENGSLVIGNMLNAASAIGVGSCYIYRAKEVFQSAEGKALQKEWGISDEYEGAGHVILGYAAETPAAAARKADYIIKI